MEELAFVLVCRVEELPSTYLGLLLGASFNLVLIWDRVEKMFHKTISMWKGHYISKGERLTLIRNTLTSLTICFRSLLSNLRKARLKLEQIQRPLLTLGPSSKKA